MTVFAAFVDATDLKQWAELQPTSGVGIIEGALGQNGVKPEDTVGREGRGHGNDLTQCGHRLVVVEDHSLTSVAWLAARPKHLLRDLAG